MTVRAALVALLAAGAVTACTSREATRTQSGGPGADVGNRDSTVRVHAGSGMYYKTPCRTERVKCSGPLPESGASGT